MKKVIIGLAILLVVGGGIILSNKNKVKDIDGNTNIVFGALVPLTGQISVLGERMRNGMELAKEDILASNKIKDFKIIYEDACDGKTTTNAARKLIYYDKVKIISSSFCLFGIDTIVPLVEKEKVILFNTAANPESVLNKKYIFSTNITIKQDAYKMANYLYNNLGARKIAMIHIATSFGESYKTNFKTKIEELGGQLVLSEEKSPDATDFRTEIYKIKNLNPDAVVIIHFGSSLGNAIKQSRELGLKSIILGDYESEDPTVLSFAGKTAEGFIISSSEPFSKSDKILDFEKRYKEKFGELPDVLASNAYDSLMLQFESYIKCKGDTECMSNELINTKDYNGASGVFSMLKDHSVLKDTIFKIVKGGKFVQTEP